MSKSGIFTSSLAKKYWMALSGLFLITFLVGHLLGNLQLIYSYDNAEAGRRAFNEYAYFMGHNIFIKILAYVTYASILLHACIGLYLAVQNKKARPKNYAYNRPGTNSGTASRYMAILGTLILIFIVTHMANFWWKQKVTGDVPLHTKEIAVPGNPMMQTEEQKIKLYLTTNGTYIPSEGVEVKNHSELYAKEVDIKVGEGYKDLHTVVMNFFGHSEQGQPTNEYALWAVILYVISMFVLMFHLWHGFGSAFQSLGLNHKKYNGLITFTGKAFSIVVPLAFAIIPVLIYFNR
jgi:succinate dehydrogenase / fumarate reductase, cytochrome b subunit